MCHLDDEDKRDLRLSASEVAAELKELLDKHDPSKSLQEPAHCWPKLLKLSDKGSAFVNEVAMRRTRAFLGGAASIDGVELSDEVLLRVALDPQRMHEQVCSAHTRLAA